MYDVTNFKKHPGQFDILLHHAGTDVSKKFHTIHDYDEVKELADKFLIGKIRKEDKNYTFEVPNHVIDAQIPSYYYILPIFIAVVLFYFMITNALH